MELFIQSELAIDALAQRLREILNIPGRNRTEYQVDQERFSEHLGGRYYALEVFGLTLDLVENAGEVEIPEMGEWQYYILMRPGADTDLQTVQFLQSYLCGVLKRGGLVAQLADSE